MNYGVGSKPPPDPGRHLLSLFMLIHSPLKTPCFSKHSIVYIEQVGVYLHLETKKGLKQSWYNLINEINKILIKEGL